jgi:hypothetical protein
MSSVVETPGWEEARSTTLELRAAARPGPSTTLGMTKA